MPENQPPSEMIRVPTLLIPVVRQLSQLHRKGHTTALLSGLQELISKFDSRMSVESTTELQQVEDKLEQIETHLSEQDELLKTNIETIAKHLVKIEQALVSGKYGGQARPQRTVYANQQPQVELQPRTDENLAKRLGVSTQSLIAERSSKTENEFISWSRHRDPMGVGWKFLAKDGFYHPIK